jgi:hypothetical protein
MQVLIALLVAHALCDYPLQGDFLSRAKNRMAPIPGVPWWQAMAAHSVIHGGAVALICGIWWLAPIEAAIHWITDDAKCRGRIGYNTDQAVHVTCKLLWFVVWLCL